MSLIRAAKRRAEVAGAVRGSRRTGGTALQHGASGARYRRRFLPPVPTCRAGNGFRRFRVLWSYNLRNLSTNRTNLARCFAKVNPNLRTDSRAVLVGCEIVTQVKR
jgi:hypothetical protein